MLVHNSEGYNDDGTKSIWKAPQPGKAEDQFEDGYRAENFPEAEDWVPPGYREDGGKAFFTPDREAAEAYAAEYGEGLIEIRIPADVYDEKFAPLERQLDGGPFNEIPVPHDLFDILNESERLLHPPMP